jgi:hypothetical protein
LKLPCFLGARSSPVPSTPPEGGERVQPTKPPKWRHSRPGRKRNQERPRESSKRSRKLCIRSGWGRTATSCRRSLSQSP